MRAVAVVRACRALVQSRAGGVALFGVCASARKEGSDKTSTDECLRTHLQVEGDVEAVPEGDEAEGDNGGRQLGARDLGHSAAGRRQQRQRRSAQRDGDVETGLPVRVKQHDQQESKVQNGKL